MNEKRRYIGRRVDHELDMAETVAETEKAPPIHDPNDHDERVSASETLPWETDDETDQDLSDL